MKRVIGRWVLFVSVVGLMMSPGCATCRGLEQGLGEDIQTGLDTSGDAIHKADAWIKEHMW